jgi:hypothetical protein
MYSAYSLTVLLPSGISSYVLCLLPNRIATLWDKELSSYLHFGFSFPGERDLCTQYVWGHLSPRDGLGTAEKRNVSDPSRDSNPVALGLVTASTESGSPKYQAGMLIICIYVTQKFCHLSSVLR